MSEYILLTGALGKAPQKRTAKSGSLYAAASMRVTAGNETVWWSLLCFSEAGQAEILRLDAGDKLSVQGQPKIEIYRGGDSEPKLSRTVFVDAVIALRPAPRERKARAAA